MDDSAGQIAADPGPAVTETPKPLPLSLGVRLQSALNLALWQNSVPFLTELTLAAAPDRHLGDVTVTLTCEPPVVAPRDWRVQALSGGQVQSLPNLDVGIDEGLLRAATEAQRATVTITAYAPGLDPVVVTRDVRILAPDEWGGAAGIPDLLAAFVTPNEAAVSLILRKTSELLAGSGAPDGLEGYQSGAKPRVWQLTEALWRAVCSLGLIYANPPPSFEQTGQRIRPPGRIRDEKLATCLDLAILFAACLEKIGLHPIIVLTHGHAFAGVWLSRHDFGGSTAEDPAGLRTRLKLDDLLLFETTLVCGRSRAGFRAACDAAARHIAPDRDHEFEAVIDIRRARQRNIRPLTTHEPIARAIPDEAPDTPIDLPPEIAPPFRDDLPAEADAGVDGSDRLTRWRKRLLDLSGRNRLLNLRLGGQQALAIDCPDPAQLEDLLAAMRGHAKSAPLRFRAWPELMTGADPRSAAVHGQRLRDEPIRAYAAEALARRELMAARSDADLQTTLTAIFRTARTAQQEGGANTLFLTIGALLWRPKGKDVPYRAPIILVPVQLERPSIRSGFSLRAHDDDTRLNATLLELLKQEYAIQFPGLAADHPPEDGSGVDVPLILDTVRAKVRDISGWEVTDDVSLTTLAFEKYLMWKDLAERADQLRGNPVARRLMDGPGEEADGRGSIALRATDPDLEPPLVCPLEADGTQTQAVAEAAGGRSFVLIGPPGTGKSQTIANIIADALARDRTVLFVAEKRAALEVVQRRMRDVGLGDLCLDLFSAQAGKSSTLAQLDRAQQLAETLAPEEWDAAAAEVLRLRGELNAYVRALHATGRNGWTAFRAMGCIVQAERAGLAPLDLAWPSEDEHDIGAFQRLVERVGEAAAVFSRTGGGTTGTALAGVERSDWSPPWQGRLLAAAETAAIRLRSVQGEADAAARLLGLSERPSTRHGLAALAALADLLRDPIACDAAWTQQPSAEKALTDLRAARSLVNELAAERGKLRGTWRDAVRSLPLADLLADWDAATRRSRVARWPARRRIRQMLEPHADGSLPDDPGRDLETLVTLRSLEARLAEFGETLRPLLGPLWCGADTAFVTLEAAHAWTSRLRAATAACIDDAPTLMKLRHTVTALVTEGQDLLAATGNVGVKLTRLCDAWAATAPALAAVTAECGSIVAELFEPDVEGWSGRLATHLTAWHEHANELRDWCAWRRERQTAAALGIAPLLHAMERGDVLPDQAAEVFNASYAHWWLGLVVEASPELSGFVAARHETRIDNFRAQDRKLLTLAARLVRARRTTAVPGRAARELDPQYGVLARELAKKARFLPIRELVSRMPQALRQLTPCLMMSPLSVAQYLPASAAPFDLVVFDEASQIPTWDAIGAIGRGRQVIVVGDPKQLPPTRFFEREMPDGEVGGDTMDLDSVLDECLGAGIQTRELRWHYRSRHESLIAFSNRAYYDGRLITFPSPVTDDRAVALRHLPHGVYDRGVSRTNAAEAEAVVAEAVRILQDQLAGGRRRSLGIVTFNSDQKTRIEDLLDAARRADPALEPFFAEEADEPVLIRNLESVQGEERDVMLFSLTFGPDAAGRVLLNFGPLNLSGGERRLNVAITRARERLLVFTSLLPDQIDLSRTAALGVRHLKEFLDFAQRGARAFATAATGPLGEHESPLESEIAARLRDRGWLVHPQIGVSGFRIDLAVVDPDRPGAYLAGVECDGATYHRGASARDRDRLRQAVLEGLGWTILRVWSTDWWTHAARETERLDAKLRSLHETARTSRTGVAATAADSAPGEQVFPDPEVGLPLPVAPAPVSPDDPGPAVDAGRFYDDDYQPQLTIIIESLIRHAEVLHLDVLAQRVARRHGFERTGKRIHGRVTTALPPEVRRTVDSAGDFVWAPEINPAYWDRFRPPLNGEARDPAEIPIEELVVLAKAVAAPEEATTLLRMRDACGLKMLREASRHRFLEAISRAAVTPEFDVTADKAPAAAPAPQPPSHPA